MAFYVGASNVERSKSGKSITFWLWVESHAVIEGGDGSPAFHRYWLKNLKAWRTSNGRIVINHPDLLMSENGKNTVEAILSRMPEVRQYLGITGERYAPMLQEAFTGTTKRLWRVQ